MNPENLSQYDDKVHTHFMAAQAMDECCGNCRKRWEPTCCEYKENRRRPPDTDWCYGWKEKKK